jgi:hypothetical protein
MTSDDAVIAVLEALDGVGVPYMLVGSFSTNVHGIDRSTKDADFVVEPGDTSILAVARQLGPRFRIEPRMSSETGALRHEVTIADSPSTIEFFGLSADPHDQERFRRRRSLTLLGRAVWLPTVEDVIITKLRWAAIAARAKDRDDARDVIAVQDVEGQIAWDYVHAWCERHGTRALRDEVRASIPPI